MESFLSMTRVGIGACNADGVRRHCGRMRASGKFVLSLAGTVLTGAAAASCMLDLSGLPGSPSASGGGAATSTAISSGGETSTGTGGGGGEPGCGNHVKELGEECDDGNLAPGDGCSTTCTTEAGDSCPGLPISLLPPGMTIEGTLVGATDNLLPGCGANRADIVYAVTPTTSGTLTVTLHGAYEKSLSVRSSCFDSKTSELDCEAGPGDLTVTKWVYANVPYHVVVDAAPQPFSLQLGLTACGDGKVQPPEECDNPADKTCIGCFRCADTVEMFDAASGHCYRRLTGQAKDWTGARADCLAWGGDLVGVSSLAEDDFLKFKYAGVWTGATDVAAECAYSWVNGEPWQPHWLPGEPNNKNDDKGENCGVLYSGFLNDIVCTDKFDALCERAPGGGCNDGMVQPGEECDDARVYTNMTCVGCVVQCPPGEIKDPVTHHCYRLVTSTGVSWDTANTECTKLGAYLATVSSPAENEMLLPILKGATWIGGRRSGTFKWNNGDVFCYANWLGEPSSDGNKSCVTLQPDGLWSNDVCSQSQGYLCERDN